MDILHSAIMVPGHSLATARTLEPSSPGHVTGHSKRPCRLPIVRAMIPQACEYLFCFIACKIQGIASKGGQILNEHLTQKPATSSSQDLQGSRPLSDSFPWWGSKPACVWRGLGSANRLFTPCTSLYFSSFMHLFLYIFLAVRFVIDIYIYLY